jgi:hypothetical protein
MNQKIIGFDQDDEGVWRAELECGHLQHVRHQPPLVTREWVLTEKGRSEKIGAFLNCKKCDEERLTDSTNESK